MVYFLSKWKAAPSENSLCANFTDEIPKLSANNAFRKLRFNISIRKRFHFVRRFGRHFLKSVSHFKYLPVLVEWRALTSRLQNATFIFIIFIHLFIRSSNRQSCHQRHFNRSKATWDHFLSVSFENRQCYSIEIDRQLTPTWLNPQPKATYIIGANT